MARWPDGSADAGTRLREKLKVTVSLEQSTMRKVARRLVPFMCLLYVIAFIIRSNVGVAALTMGCGAHVAVP